MMSQVCVFCEFYTKTATVQSNDLYSFSTVLLFKQIFPISDDSLYSVQIGDIILLSAYQLLYPQCEEEIHPNIQEKTFPVKPTTSSVQTANVHFCLSCDIYGIHQIHTEHRHLLPVCLPVCLSFNCMSVCDVLSCILVVCVHCAAPADSCCSNSNHEIREEKWLMSGNLGSSWNFFFF